MPEISVGAAINEGFALIRRSPVVVLIWGLTQVAVLGLTVAILSPLYVAMFEVFRTAGAGGDPSAIAANPALMQMQGLSYLVDIAQLVVAAVLYCAAYRAVLHPEASRFGYLRLSMAELYIGALFFGAGMAFFIGLLVVVIVVAIFVGVLIAVHLAPVAIAVGVVATLGIVAGLVYIALRFSLIGPMIVDDGKFHFEEAWALTRGHVLRLFLVGLVLSLIVLAAGIVLDIVLAAIGFGGLALLAGGPANLPALLQQPGGQLLARLSPFLVLAAIIWVPYAGCLNAIMLAPWAKAYRDLKPIDVSATFA